MKTEVINDTPSNVFIKNLNEIRGGRSASELSEALTQLVDAVRENGKPGTLTYKITIRPASKGKIQVLSVEDEITHKMPKPARDNTIFYATQDNMLQRNDPNQRTLNLSLRTVDVASTVENTETKQAAQA